MKKLMFVALISLAVVVQVKAYTINGKYARPISCEWGSMKTNKFDDWFLSPSVQIGLAMASPSGNPAAAGQAAANIQRQIQYGNIGTYEVEGQIHRLFFGNNHCAL